MKLTQFTTGDNGSFSMIFQADGDAFATALDKACEKRGAHYSVPGYDRGKAPRADIEAKYGKNVFWYDAYKIIMRSEFDAAYKAGCEEHKVSSICEPVLNVENVSGETGFSVSVTGVELPSIEKEAYIGLPVSIVYPAISDKDVQKELDNLRAAHPQLVDVDEAAGDNHVVVLTLIGTNNGEKVHAACAADFRLPMHKKDFLPGVTEALAGHHAGDSVAVTSVFPKDHMLKELAGMTVDYAITLDRVCRTEIPPEGDQFASQFGGCDTWAQLRERVRERMEKRLRNNAEARVAYTLQSKAAANYGITAPKAFIDEQFDTDWHHFLSMLGMQKTKLEDFLTRQNMTKEQLKERLRADAAQEAAQSLTLLAIARAENLHPSERELADQYQEYRTKIEKLPEDDREEISRTAFEENLKKELASHFLRSNAKVKMG